MRTLSSSWPLWKPTKIMIWLERKHVHYLCFVVLMFKSSTCLFRRKYHTIAFRHIKDTLLQHIHYHIFSMSRCLVFYLIPCTYCPGVNIIAFKTLWSMRCSHGSATLGSLAKNAKYIKVITYKTWMKLNKSILLNLSLVKVYFIYCRSVATHILPISINVYTAQKCYQKCNTISSSNTE